MVEAVSVAVELRQLVENQDQREETIWLVSPPPLQQLPVHKMSLIPGIASFTFFTVAVAPP